MVDITISEILSSYSSATKINSNFEAVQDGLADALSMSNGGALGDILDMDSNSIINLPEPVLPHEPATKAYVDAVVIAGEVEIATTVEQITDLDPEWKDSLEDVTVGMTIPATWNFTKPVNFSDGTYLAPITPDPTHGSVAVGVTHYVDPGIGVSHPLEVAIVGSTKMTVGEGHIACGVLAVAETLEDWDPGSNFEAGCVPLFTSGYTTKAGAVFGAGIHASAATTAGSNVQGVEVDVSDSSTGAAQKTGVLVISPSSDTGTTTGTYTVNGGNTLLSEQAFLIGAVSTGTGFNTGLTAIKVTGGTQPIKSAGQLIRSGGYTTAYGWNARDHVTTGALILGANDSNLIAGRNAANTADVPVARVAGDDSVVIGNTMTVYPVTSDVDGIRNLSLDGTLDLGNATDATISRVGAGRIAVEGSNVLVATDIGTTVQAYDADLATYASITPAANTQSFLGAADYAAMRTLLNSTRPYFRAVLASNQTGIADSSYTVIQYATEQQDNGGYYNNGTYRWTPPAGPVILGATAVGSNTSVVGSAAQMFIFKNGSILPCAAQPINTTLANGFALAVQNFDVANGTDYYEVRIFLDVASGTSTISSNSEHNVFWGISF